MINYQAEKFIKTLTKRKIQHTNAIETNKNIKLDLEQQTLNQYKLLKVENDERQNGSFFNKELLKNKKKIYQDDHNELKSPSKQDSTYVNPGIRRTQNIGYRNVKLLRSFLTDYKKIKPRRLTRLTLKQQRQLSKSVKRARTLKLFDPRKTLKPQKFLNFEKKNEIIDILLILQILKLKKFIKLIKDLDIKNLINVTQCLTKITDYENEFTQRST